MNPKYKFPADLEGRFYEFLYRTGESNPEWTRRVLAFYIPFFANCHRVLDVGCGQGDFLELLREHGILGVGIDIDEKMIRICREKGLEVYQVDLFEYLSGQEMAFDGIFCSNLVEHMPTEFVLRFFQLAYRALHPGGIFLVSTPNSESLIVHLHEFWRDPTHIRLYDLSLLKFMMEYAGFKNVYGNINPETRWIPPIDISEHKESMISTNVDLFNIPDFPGTNGLISIVLRKIRRSFAKFVVRTLLFEEFFVINKMLIYWVQELTKPREIYVFGVRKDE